jgi:hypothetical protein
MTAFMLVTALVSMTALVTRTTFMMMTVFPSDAEIHFQITSFVYMKCLPHNASYADNGHDNLNLDDYLS